MSRNLLTSNCNRLVAVVTETWSPDINGVAMSTQRMVSGLLQLGHRVQLFHLCGGRVNDNSRVESHALPGFTLPFYQAVRIGFPAGRYIRNVWQKQRPDMVQIVTEGPLGASAMTVARSMGIPVISEFHTNFDQYSRYYHLRLVSRWVKHHLRAFHNRADVTLVPTRELRDQLTRDGFHHMRVLRRGVDTQLFHPNRRDQLLRDAWGVGAEELAVIFVGRLAAEKNIDLAVRAFRAIQNRQPEARFVLVGDGPMRKKLEQENPDFIFCGIQKGEELASHYASGDLFLAPSTTETFGNTIIEAMASQLPVISFDYACTREHVSHGLDGLAIRPGDEDEFIHSAEALCQSGTQLIQIGRNARITAESIRWEKVYKHFDRITRELTGEASYDDLPATSA